MSFRKALQALAAGGTETVKIEGQSFDIRVLSTGEVIELAEESKKGDREATLALLRAGVVMEADVTDEEILSLKPSVSQELAERIRELNGLKAQGDDEGN